MFNELKAAILGKKVDEALAVAETEVLGITEEEREVAELAALHEASKLDGIEFAVLFLEDAEDANEMDDELDDAEDGDDGLLTTPDVDEADMDLPDESASSAKDMEFSSEDEQELLNSDEIFEVADEMPGDDAGMSIDSDLEGLDIDDIEEELI